MYQISCTLYWMWTNLLNRESYWEYNPFKLESNYRDLVGTYIKVPSRFLLNSEGLEKETGPLTAHSVDWQQHRMYEILHVVITRL